MFGIAERPTKRHETRVKATKPSPVPHLLIYSQGLSSLPKMEHHQIPFSPHEESKPPQQLQSNTIRMDSLQKYNNQTIASDASEPKAPKKASCSPKALGVGLAIFVLCHPTSAPHRSEAPGVVGPLRTARHAGRATKRAVLRSLRLGARGDLFLSRRQDQFHTKMRLDGCEMTQTHRSFCDRALK